MKTSKFSTMTYAECCKAARSLASDCGIDVGDIISYMLSDEYITDLLNFFWAGKSMHDGGNLYWTLATKGICAGRHYIMMNVTMDARKDSCCRTLLIYPMREPSSTPIAISRGFENNDVDRHLFEKQLREYIAMLNDMLANNK